MSLNLYKVQDFLKIPYAFSYGDDSNHHVLRLVVDNPLLLSISRIPPPYSSQEFNKGIWKPVIHFDLVYDPNPDLEKLTVCKLRDRTCDSETLFSGRDANINQYPDSFIFRVQKEDLESISSILRIRFPYRFQKAFERAKGSDLIRYLEKAKSSLESLAHAEEQAYLLQDTQISESLQLNDL